MYSVLAVVAELIPLALDSYYQEMWYRFKLPQQMTLMNQSVDSVKSHCLSPLTRSDAASGQLGKPFRNDWVLGKSKELPLTFYSRVIQTTPKPSHFFSVPWVTSPAHIRDRILGVPRSKGRQAMTTV